MKQRLKTWLVLLLPFAVAACVAGGYEWFNAAVVTVDGAGGLAAKVRPGQRDPVWLARFPLRVAGVAAPPAPDDRFRDLIRNLKKRGIIVVVVDDVNQDAVAVAGQRRVAEVAGAAGADLVVLLHAAQAPRVENIGGGPVLVWSDAAGSGRSGASLHVRAEFSPRGLERIRISPIFQGNDAPALRVAQAATRLMMLSSVAGPLGGHWENVDGVAVIDGASFRSDPDGLAILSAFYERFRRGARLPAAVIVAVGLGGWLLRRRPLAHYHIFRRGLPPALGAVALAAGLHFAWRDKALSDDAYISFRYAKNWLAGNGLVYNVGERVEGYTNFLWTVLVGALAWVTRQDIPLVALFANFACLAGALATTWAIGRRLNRPDDAAFYFPLATLWLGAQRIFCSFGAIGLETMFAAWLVLLAAYARLARPPRQGAALAGVFLILATLARPDHAIFYACFAAVLALGGLGKIWTARREARRAADGAAFWEAACFAAPFAGYLIFLAWEWRYYGSIVPNTYFAKSVDLAYWSQGLVYGLVSGLSTNLLFLLPLFAAWLLFLRDPRVAEFRRFAGLGVAVYAVYVIKLGGDFMLGRFFMTAMPLILLGVENAAHQLARATDRRPAWTAVAWVALLLSTLYGWELVRPGNITWGISDEGTFYRVRSFRPLDIEQEGAPGNRLDEGVLFRRVLTERGLRPVVAMSGFGIIGYYSEMPVLDLRGLIDTYVAHLPVGQRSRPGHEKWAPPAYRDYRQARFYRLPASGLPRDYARFSIEHATYSLFQMARYDGALMDRIAHTSPEFKFTRFPEYLDKNTARLVRDTPAAVADALRQFDHYYFSLNSDARRRQPFVDRFLQLLDFEDGAYPPGTEAEGVFENAFVRPAFDRDFRIEDYQGETLVATPAGPHGPGKLALPPFTVRGDVIGFLFAGGRDPDRLNARLYVDGEPVNLAVGNDTSRLAFITWDVAKYKGRTARLVLENTTADKRLFFDMFYEAEKKPGEASAVAPAP
jgi:hypothetical protein